MHVRLLAALTSSALALALAAAAFANPTIGGHDETKEAFDVWSNAHAASPGIDNAVGAAPHVLITEVCVTPTGSEFIEITNPTGAPVDLTNFCLSDHWSTGGGDVFGYFQRPYAGYFVVPTRQRFNVCFPAGTILAPDGVLTIAPSATGFFAVYGFYPDFEIREDVGGVPTMVDVAFNAQQLPADLLTDNSWFVVLYYWDGISDLVCDVDCFAWGEFPEPGERAYKTGHSVDGPDPDVVPSPYNPDSISQPGPSTHPAGASFQRQGHNEVVEVATGGNGCIELATPSRMTTWGNVKQIYR